METYSVVLVELLCRLCSCLTAFEFDVQVVIKDGVLRFEKPPLSTEGFSMLIYCGNMLRLTSLRLPCDHMPTLLLFFFCLELLLALHYLYCKNCSAEISLFDITVS